MDIIRALLLAAAVFASATHLHAQTVPSQWEPIVDPTKSYVGVDVHDDWRPLAPDISFYPNASLAGKPLARFDKTGFSIGGKVICIWHPTAFDLSNRSITLHSPSDLNVACPADVPIKTQRAESPLLELARIDLPAAEVRYRGKSYYFDLRKLPDAYEGHQGPALYFPLKAPVLRGGVDVPAAFRPRRGSPLRLTLYDRPSDGAKPLLTVTSIQYLDRFGVGEGTLLASVYERSNRWSLVRFIDGRMGWLSPADSGKFMSLERMLTLNDEDRYLTDRWDRRLVTTPGGTETFEVAPDPRRKWIGWLVPANEHPGNVPLFERPDRSAPALGEVGPMTRLRLLALNDSRPLVFSRQNGWIEVVVDDDRCYRPEANKHAWIADVPGRWDVRPADPAETDDLWFAAWGKPIGTSVKILATRRVQGVLWLRVRVFLGEACERALCTLPDTILGEGWLPAHDSFGGPIVWFETYCD